MVVAFESAERAWVVLVGAHRDDDPGRDIYDQLYELAGIRPGPDQRRNKPPCCDEDPKEPPILDEEAVATLVERARALVHAGRARSRTRGTRLAGAGRPSPRR